MEINNKNMDNKYLSAQRDYYAQFKSELIQFKDYAQDNWGVIVTALYFIGSFAGLLYLSTLLGQFNINVFNHIEVSDYLLAVLSNGEIISVMSLFILVMIFVLRKYLKKEYKVKEDTWLNRLSTRISAPFYIKPPLPFFFLACILSLCFYSWTIAKGDGSDIRDNGYNRYNVTLTYPVKLKDQDFVQLNNIALITSTSANVFFYHKEFEQAVIVPHSNIAALVSLARKKRQRRKDTDN